MHIIIALFVASFFITMLKSAVIICMINFMFGHDMIESSFANALAMSVIIFVLQTSVKLKLK